jgi:hypothetical protein
MNQIIQELLEKKRQLAEQRQKLEEILAWLDQKYIDNLNKNKDKNEREEKHGNL